MTEPLTPERRRGIREQFEGFKFRVYSTASILALLDALDAETERNTRLEARIATLEKSKEMLLQRLDYISRLSEGEEVER